MIKSGPWLQRVSEKLAANDYLRIEPEKFQPLGYRYAVRRLRGETLLSGFGRTMIDIFFVFADIQNLSPGILGQFSNSVFQFSIQNLGGWRPRGFNKKAYCFAVAITEALDPQLAEA